MTREEFDRFVHNIENGIGRNPPALRRRVAYLAFLGYVLLLSGLVFVFLLAAGFFTVMYWADLEGKIVCGAVGSIILLGGGFSVLRALIIKVPPPQGIPVLRADAPKLFALLDDLQARLTAAPFHSVLFIPAQNAAVVQVPQLGLLGFNRNYLLLGMPLLDGHSSEEIRSILAHEFAHLSKQHGRFSHWIYRLRRSWEALFARLAQPRIRGQITFRPLLVKMVNFFWPRFNAHAFVLSRAHEYEADALAAESYGAEHMAGALTRRALQDRFLEQNFWPDLWRMANAQPEPPPDVFVRLACALSRESSPELRGQWLSEALAVPTTNADTHPCLAERLRALQKIPLPIAATSPSVTAPVPSASDSLLQPALTRLRDAVQELWCKEIKPAWQSRYARASALSDRLSNLEQVVPDQSQDLESLWDKAALLLDLKGDQQAESVLRQILSRRPDHVRANFQLGRLLLGQRREEGQVHLERAMAEDDDLVPQGCALLREHYRRSGRPDQLRQIELRLDQYEKDLAASRAERREVTVHDSLIPHDLAENELEALRKVLAADPMLAQAYLARKELRHFPKQKLFLLCVRRKRPWHHLPNSTADRALVDRISRAICLPGRVLVFSPSGGYRALARKVGIDSWKIWR